MTDIKDLMPWPSPGDERDLARDLPPRQTIEEFAPLVEALEPLPDDERARVLLYCLLKYVPGEFCNVDLYGLMERARGKPNGRKSLLEAARAVSTDVCGDGPNCPDPQVHDVEAALQNAVNAQGWIIEDKVIRLLADVASHELGARISR